MHRRLLAWAVVAAAVALVAYAPFRDDGGGRGDGGGGGGSVVAGGGDGGGTSTPGPTTTTTAGSATRPSSTTPPGRSTTAPPPAPAPGSTAAPTATTAPATPTTTPPPAPELPEPTDEQLAVLGPLIAAMDKGQTAGTPLVLGIATSILALGLPTEADVPAELRPVVQAVADLIATPGTMVNDLTAQNSLYLAHLDRALGELAYLNPALNATIHEVAGVLTTMGRAAEPISPPGAVLLTDLAALLDYFVV